ncbi:MAG: hypothetical protein ACREPN_04565 [Rudaea sp.]
MTTRLFLALAGSQTRKWREMRYELRLALAAVCAGYWFLLKHMLDQLPTGWFEALSQYLFEPRDIYLSFVISSVAVLWGIVTVVLGKVVLTL